MQVYLKNLILITALAALTLTAACNAIADRVAPAAARETQAIALVTVQETSTPTFQPTSPSQAVTLPVVRTLSPTAEPTEPIADGTVAAPSPSTAAPSSTPTPTVPPPLPLRDDLQPMELQDFPRPADDNGLCIHFTPTGYYKPADLDKNIARLKSLHSKWALVLYADENQLELAAQKFHDAGIMVVWRKTLRPYQKYFGWGRDIEILNRIGMPPYLQVYNEPELEVEWEDQPMDIDLYFTNLIQAFKDIYNAGGYPGLQVLDEDYLRRFIDEMFARKADAIFHRMFFVAHAPGLNHPPDYVEDINGVLGFRAYATIFFKRLGFVPPMIAGEGGWKIDSHEDNRFPPINDQLHHDYTLAVYDWFRTGTLSNGGKLPDYLFAFCHWLLAANDEAGAWFDSFKGDRTLTIQAVEALPPFTRKFSWE